jgi:DNA repair protein RadC
MITADRLQMKPSQPAEIRSGLLSCELDTFTASPNADAVIAQALKCLEGRLPYGDALANPRDAKNYLRLQLAPEINEVFAVLFLSSKHRVLAFEKLFFGTINAAMIHPRVVAQRALANNAAAVICAHNHPSGNAEPSKADIEITRVLKTALELFDVHLLDHLVVTAYETQSLAECGLL